MSDIMMCVGNECPVKSCCYRYTAEPDQKQDYYDFTMTCNLENGFPDYLVVTVENGGIR